MAKLNLSTATRDEMVDLIRRQAMKVKELHNASLLLEERDARLASMELTVQLCKEELAEARASHAADALAMQEQIQQLSQAVVDAHERLAASHMLQHSSSVASAKGDPTAASRSRSPGASQDDPAMLTMLHGRLARLEVALQAKTVECSAVKAECDASQARLKDVVAELEANGGRQRLMQLEAELQASRGELQECCVELRGHKQHIAELLERVESLAQQLASFELTSLKSHTHERGDGIDHHGVPSSKRRSSARMPRPDSTTAVNAGSAHSVATPPMPKRSGSTAAFPPGHTLANRGAGSASPPPHSSSSSSSSSSHSDTTSSDDGDQSVPRTTMSRHHPAPPQQHARVIGLDGGGGGATTGGPPGFSAVGNAAARLQRQLNDATADAKRRDEAAAARTREEISTRLELQETIRDLQSQLDAARRGSERQQKAQQTDDVVVAPPDAAGDQLLAELGITAVMLHHHASAISRLVEFYHSHRHDGEDV